MVSIFYIMSTKSDCGCAVWGPADCGERQKMYARLILGLREATHKQIHMKSHLQEWYIQLSRCQCMCLSSVHESIVPSQSRSPSICKCIFRSCWNLSDNFFQWIIAFHLLALLIAWFSLKLNPIHTKFSGKNSNLLFVCLKEKKAKFPAKNFS